MLIRKPQSEIDGTWCIYMLESVSITTRSESTKLHTVIKPA